MSKLKAVNALRTKLKLPELKKLPINLGQCCEYCISALCDEKKLVVFRYDMKELRHERSTSA